MKNNQTLTVRCPTCRKHVDWEVSPARPFCSERCRLLDLGKWSEQAYCIAGETLSPDAGEPNPFPPEEKG